MRFFGLRIQRTVQEAIAHQPGYFLPVGASLVVRTGHAHIPFLIVAPTMELPGPVEAKNAYRAMRAILRVAAEEPLLDRSVFCPGLATGVGMVSPVEAAKMMADAYRDWKSPREKTG